MAIESPARLTVEEYLAWEETNFEKHEYIDGEVRCMAGAKGPHNRIMSNTNVAIGMQLLDSDCGLFSSEMKVKAGETRYLYPDLSVVCGEARYEAANAMVLLNPLIVVEVTSHSSMRIDRIDKRAFYLDVPSIEAYLIIDQHRICVELSVRANGKWITESFTGLDDVVPLDVISCALPLSIVYRQVKLDELNLARQVPQ